MTKEHGRSRDIRRCVRPVKGAAVVLAAIAVAALLWPDTSVRRPPVPETFGRVVVPARPAGSAATGIWPGAGHDTRHSGATSLLGPSTGAIRWTRVLEGAVTPGPVVGGDGTIYATSNAGVLHALDPRTGRDRWTFDGHGSYGSDLSTSPLVAGDGTVLWPGPNRTLFALDTAGTELWHIGLGGLVLSPALANGFLVVVDMTGTVSAYRWPGAGVAAAPEVVWTRDLGAVSYSSPAIAGGVVYTAADNDLFAVDLESGRVLWRVATAGLIEVSPSVTPDGTVVVSSNDPFVYGVGPGGTVRWRHRRGALSYSSPSTTATGLAYLGDHRGGVEVLNATTGASVARYQGPGAMRRGQSIGVWTSPLVDGAHRVYAGTRHGHVLGFAPDGRALFDLAVGATVDSYPALTADGALVVGVTDGRLLAIADDTTPCSTARRAADADRLAYSPYRPDAVVGVVTDLRAIALGVDDGPDRRDSPALLRVLEDHGAKATFFALGRAVEANPELVRAEADAGHEIANHTFDHRDLVGRSAPEVVAQLRDTETAIRRSGATPVRLLRPPRGKQDDVAAEAACTAGWRTIGWTITLENHLADAADVGDRLQPGDIVLLHDGGGRAATPAALDRMLTKLDARGIKAVSVGALLRSAGVASKSA